MTTRISEVVQHLRKTLLRQDGAGLSDGQLLGLFVEERDEAAVAALIRRHGPMVWGVCRRVLGNQHDAEDAFQATFLVLVRRAAAIAPREMVGNWLYGVAHRTALKARAVLARLRTREKHVADLPAVEVEPHGLWHDLLPVLDRELSRLPDMYRAAIVLCDLEGKTRPEAARQLGVPPGTLAARLTRGRALLAKRMARHGLAVSSGTLTAVFAEQAVPACQSTSLIASTIKAVTSVAAGQAANTGLISAQAAALTEGMVRTMFLSKLKMAAGIVLVLTVSAAGGLFFTTRADGSKEDAPPVVREKTEDMRAAAVRAVEQFGKSAEASDREAAIKALIDFRKELKVAEEARKLHLDRAARSIAERFKYRVPVELGVSEFKDGCRIDISEVWGTRPRIEGNGQYLVRGKYTMPSHERGKLYFYLTTTNMRAFGGSAGNGRPDFISSNLVATLDLQDTDVRKGQGEFTLVHGMFDYGYFHLQLLDESNKSVANVYFGTGDNVLRKKSW